MRMTLPTLRVAHPRTTPASEDDRTATLDRRERRIAERERALEKAEAKLRRERSELEDREDAARLPGAVVPFTDARRPVTAEPTAASPEAIILAGQVRRGEISETSGLPQGAAGEIIRAGKMRRGEIAAEQPRGPQTEQQACTAADILRAGRIRRGEEAA